MHRGLCSMPDHRSIVTIHATMRIIIHNNRKKVLFIDNTQWASSIHIDPFQRSRLTTAYIYIWHMVGSAGALNHSSSCSQPVSLQNNQTMLSSWSQLCRPTWYVQNTINVASRKTWWAHRPVIHTEWSMDAKWFVRSRPPHAIKVFINYNSAHGSPNTKTCTSFICHI